MMCFDVILFNFNVLIKEEILVDWKESTEREDWSPSEKYKGERKKANEKLPDNLYNHMK